MQLGSDPKHCGRRAERATDYVARPVCYNRALDEPAHQPIASEMTAEGDDEGFKSSPAEAQFARERDVREAVWKHKC